MRSSRFARLLAAAAIALLPIAAPTAAPLAQTGTSPAPAPLPAEAPQPPTLQDLPAPGVGTAECAWIGQRIIMLLWRDDIDTANRFFNVYDRFACPPGHSGLAFRCLVQLGQGEGEGDPGLPERARACWENPALDPATLMPPQPQQPAEGGQPAEGEQPKSN